jgi:hypothetical protein
MSLRRLIPGLVATTILVACDPSKPEVASTKFDGTYVGTIHLTADSPSDCINQQDARMVILNGKLDYNYANGAAVFHSAVYEDGSFSDWVTNKLSGMAAHLEGQIVGGSSLKQPPTIAVAQINYT